MEYMSDDCWDIAAKQEVIARIMNQSKRQEMVLPIMDLSAVKGLTFGDVIRISSAKTLGPGVFYGNKRHYLLGGGVGEPGTLTLNLYKINPWKDDEVKEREDVLFMKNFISIKINLLEPYYPINFDSLNDGCRYYLDKVTSGFDTSTIEDDKSLTRHREWYLASKDGCGFMSPEDALKIKWPE